jgi:hypothetical protein
MRGFFCWWELFHKARLFHQTKNNRWVLQAFAPARQKKEARWVACFLLRITPIALSPSSARQSCSSQPLRAQQRNLS